MSEPWDRLGRIDTSLLYPPFLEKLCDLSNALEAQGAIFIATSGLRTYGEQTTLYAHGRTQQPDGTWVKTGSVVTNAPAGYSPHNFSVGADLTKHNGATYEGKLNPDYDDAHYAIIGPAAASVGLEWGGDWAKFKDFPHVQLPLRSRGITWGMMRLWYDKGGLENVFKELDARGPW